MASFRTLRPFGKRPASAGPSTVLGLGSPAAFAGVISLVAAALLAAIQLAKPAGQADRSAPSFLIQALGLRQPDAALHRKPARGGTAAVSIVDLKGEAVTPAGLRWSLRRSAGRWQLQLRLEDWDLPTPNVVDPAIKFRNSSTFGSSGIQTTIQLPMPTRVVRNDVML